jgi:EpsD family peptidyl-prolyl cis-trans isomerase
MEMVLPSRWKSLARGRRAALVLGCCAIALAGCGKKDQGVASSGQIVAHVGDQDVTIQELDNEFRFANIPPEKQKDPAIIKQVLSELVLRKYLLQQALNAKLDREPGVLLDLLRARAQVLATAYVSRAIGAKPITQTEVDSYIAKNPLKFADRQILTSEQIAFALGPNAQTIIDDSKDAKSLDEVDQRLTLLGIPHNRSKGAISSAELPEDFYNLIEAKKVDNVFFVRSGPNGVFFAVKGQEKSPLTGEAAANTARQLLRAERLKAETGMASFSANMETKYEGDYAAIMGKTGEPSPAGKN